jgi:alkylhydroperoxidase family enzyme
MKALACTRKIFTGGFALAAILWSATFAVADGRSACLPMLDDESAWSRLPPLEEGQRQPLPAWARMLADSLPRTTAAMLQLDALHRQRSPLGAELAGKVRWTVAKANRCAYSMAAAEGDLRRAGLDEAALESFKSGSAMPLREERLILEFARRLTSEADEITDEEAAQVAEIEGDRKLVALVLLVAHSNFQDRLFLALGAVTDLGAPLPPFEGRFAKADKDAPLAVPERAMPEAAAAPPAPEQIDDPEWRALDFAALQRRLDLQRERNGRIRVPTWEEVAEKLPEDQRPKHPVHIRWSLVCRGYQPELAAAWSACTRAFAEESKQDRVFEESLFWVITRTIHCFY